MYLVPLFPSPQYPILKDADHKAWSPTNRILARIRLSTVAMMPRPLPIRVYLWVWKTIWTLIYTVITAVLFMALIPTMGVVYRVMRPYLSIAMKRKLAMLDILLFVNVVLVGLFLLWFGLFLLLLITGEININQFFFYVTNPIQSWMLLFDGK